MTTFTINGENNITAHTTAAEVKGQPEAEVFSSAKELGTLAGNWTSSRLVEIWNALPGQKPVKKFTSRKTAVSRIWAAIQHLSPNGGAQAPTVAPKNRLEPPCTDPYARWCGRGRRVTAAPMPILSATRK